MEITFNMNRYIKTEATSLMILLTPKFPGCQNTEINCWKTNIKQWRPVVMINVNFSGFQNLFIWSTECVLAKSNQNKTTCKYEKESDNRPPLFNITFSIINFCILTARKFWHYKFPQLTKCISWVRVQGGLKQKRDT